PDTLEGPNFGMTAWRATGSEHGCPYWLALLAEAHGSMGQPAEALALVETHGECHWEAELYRLEGESVLGQATGHAVAAEACFQHALEIARRQQAKSLELRGAVSLSRLWQHQGKGAAARQLLAGVYGWFTEGFDTVDLQEARALLDALS
ncbi:MAG: hypothetical protein ACREOH_05050, partial [Candidatus Entotheonellia bacterium]